MANRFQIVMQSAPLMTLLVVLGSSTPATAAMGLIERVPDQYQCRKSSGDEATIDLILNGSQNFQGIARTKKGQLVEVAGIIADPYAMSVETKQEVDRAVERYKNGEWEVFAAELQLTNQLMAKKYKESGNNEMAEITSMLMMGGFGFGGSGATSSGGYPASNQNTSTDKGKKSPYGGGMMSTAPGMGIGTGMGGGMFGYGFYGGPSMISTEEAASIRKQAVEIVTAKRKRDKDLQEEIARAAAYQKVYGPPPVPELPRVPDRPGDQVAARPGDLAVQTSRPGDIAAETLRPGDKVKERPGDTIAATTRPGDMAVYGAMKPGDIAATQLRPGDKVPKAAGALIGTANSLTFTALIDPSTGKVVRMIYRDENKPTQAMTYTGDMKASDPLQSRVMQYVQRVQKYAACCQQDSTANCDQKYSPVAQEVLQEFRKDTEEALFSTEPGGAIFNPFTGRPAPRGTYGPATNSGSSSGKSRGTSK